MTGNNPLCTCGAQFSADKIDHEPHCLLSNAEFDAYLHANPAGEVLHKKAKKRAMLTALLTSVIDKGEAAEKEFRRAFRKWDKARTFETSIIHTLERLDKEDQKEQTP